MALLPPFFLDTVVAIGEGDDASKRQWIGSGFIYGRLLPDQSQGKRYQLFLITNKHVFRGRSDIYVKFNSALDPTSKDYRALLLSRNGKPTWIGHPNAGVDVAALSLNANFLQAENRKFAFFESDSHVMGKESMKKHSVTEGDRVFVLGFPMAMVSAERQYVICRGGVIARVRDYLEGKATDFLIDSTVFPGNSGGPVITCPSVVAITGTEAISRADLIGIVKSYVPYREVAVSPQTGMPRMMFEENSGLSAVESLDSIVQTVQLAAKRIKMRAAVSNYRARKAARPPTPTSVGPPMAPSAGSPPDTPKSETEKPKTPESRPAACAATRRR